MQCKLYQSVFPVGTQSSSPAYRLRAGCGAVQTNIEAKLVWLKSQAPQSWHFCLTVILFDIYRNYLVNNYCDQTVVEVMEVTIVTLIFL